MNKAFFTLIFLWSVVMTFAANLNEAHRDAVQDGVWRSTGTPAYTETGEPQFHEPAEFDA